MRDVILIAAGACIIVAALVLLRPRKTIAGDMDTPMDVERQRAKSEAQMAAPITEADEEAAAPLVAYVEEIGTSEFPTLAFDADPLGAPIPDGYVIEDEAYFNEAQATWLSAFTWAIPVEPSVSLSSAPVFKPIEAEPLALEGPTGVFSKDWIARVMADAEAKAGTR